MEQPEKNLQVVSDEIGMTASSGLIQSEKSDEGSRSFVSQAAVQSTVADFQTFTS